MKQSKTMLKRRFVLGSLVWSLLLYACITCIINWKVITGHNNNEPVVYTGQATHFNPVKVSIDSLQKRISITSGIIRYVANTVNFRP